MRRKPKQRPSNSTQPTLATAIATAPTQSSKRSAIPTKFTPRFWADCDRRFAAVRCILQKVDALKADAGADSAQRAILCERAAFLVCIVESAEVAAATGETFDVGSYVQSVNGLLGVLKSLGLERKSKPVLSLARYVADQTPPADEAVAG